jgi:nucleotide-binding universal stress UspA family protein
MLRALSVVDTRVFNEIPASPITGYDPLGLETRQRFEEETRMESERNQLLEDTRRRTEAAGIKADVFLERGEPTQAIFANEAIVDLIALGHRGHRSTWDRWFMGSVAEDVVRRSTRPVLLSPEGYATIRRVLVGYDGSDQAKHALQWAADLASTMCLTLDVLHVGRNHEQGHALLRDAREYLLPYELRTVHAIVREGQVAEQILATAVERGASLIVMGAHGHSRIREALLGSATEEVLQKMEVPVLMTR